MKIKTIILGLFIFSLVGCANTEMYHWGEYSETLYSFTNEPSSETRDKHKAELISIITEAKNKKKLVPPGVNFELAMLIADEGDLQQAKKYFIQEQALFPESEKYVALAIKELEIQ